MMCPYIHYQSPSFSSQASAAKLDILTPAPSSPDPSSASAAAAAAVEAEEACREDVDGQGQQWTVFPFIFPSF